MRSQGEFKLIRGGPLPLRPRRPRDQAEFRLHVAIMDLLRWAGHPDVVFLHVANGEYRTDITRQRLARMGVLPGAADVELVLPPNGRSAWLELKVGKGCQSEAQKRFQERVERVGALYAVAHGYDEARAILEGWGAIRRKAA